MKKYVIVSGLDVKGLEDKVVKHIEKGYEPCGGLVVTSHKGQEVLSQAMWLNPPILVSGGKLTFDDVVEFGKEQMKDGN